MNTFCEQTSYRCYFLSPELINYTQPVYVRREDPNSRQNTIREIRRRTTSPDGWQQILIFPEGTCTNRKGLITFKPGAFYPGVPVQPVCIRYPNRLDTLSWTWQGPGAYVSCLPVFAFVAPFSYFLFFRRLKLLWLTMTQLYTYCELEFLPVYVPTEEEKLNPKLFASNVRNVMAKYEIFSFALLLHEILFRKNCFSQSFASPSDRLFLRRLPTYEQGYEIRITTNHRIDRSRECSRRVWVIQVIRSVKRGQCFMYVFILQFGCASFRK